MKYAGEIIHFIGGMTPFLGELDQGDHPNGPNWYRIKNPCLIKLVPSETGPKTAKIDVTTLEGDNNYYRKYVDIRIPPDSILEIRTLDKKGEFYKMYDAAQKRIKKGLIHRVGNQGSANIVGVN